MYAELICIEDFKGVENEQQDNYKHKETQDNNYAYCFLGVGNWIYVTYIV